MRKLLLPRNPIDLISVIPGQKTTANNKHRQNSKFNKLVFLRNDNIEAIMTTIL